MPSIAAIDRRCFVPTRAPQAPPAPRTPQPDRTPRWSASDAISWRLPAEREKTTA